MRAVRLVSVTAVATATCALWAMPASAAMAVTKHPSTTAVSASPASAWVGSSVKLSATVRSSGRIPTGTVTFRWAGRTLCAGLLVRGRASCRTRFRARGRYLVKGVYSGDATHARSSGTTIVAVRRSPTTTRITNAKNGVITVGKTYTFHVAVTSPAGTPAATGTVRLGPVVPTTLPGYYCNAKLVAGRGSCTVKPFEYGIDNYKATYGGNAAHTGSASNGKFTLAVQNVTKTTVAAPSTAVGSVTLNALVYAMGANITAPAGHGSVTFYLSSTSGSPGTVVTGCAGLPLTSFSGAPNFENLAACTANPELNGLKAGTYYITAVFSGDDVNVKSTSPQFKLTLS